MIEKNYTSSSLLITLLYYIIEEKLNISDFYTKIIFTLYIFYCVHFHSSDKRIQLKENFLILYPFLE